MANELGIRDGMCAYGGYHDYVLRQKGINNGVRLVEVVKVAIPNFANSSTRGVSETDEPLTEVSTDK